MAKTNWNRIVEKRNATDHRWPDGWSSREQVAEELECSPDRVHSLLTPAIKAGDVEAQDFSVWDDLVKRLVRVRGYRERPAKGTKIAPQQDEIAPQLPATGSKLDAPTVKRIREFVSRHGGVGAVHPAQVQDAIRLRDSRGNKRNIPTAAIRELFASLP